MKNDINLIYKRKQQKEIGKKWAVLLLGVVFFAGALYAGIMLPSKSLTTTKLTVEDLDAKLVKNGGIEAEYLAKTKELMDLDEQLKSLEQIATAQSDVALYIDLVEESLPKQANITHMAMFNKSMEVIGVADSDEVLAAFSIRLREKNVFHDIYVTTSTVMLGDETTTMFKLTATLPVSLSNNPAEMQDEQAQDGDGAQPDSQSVSPADEQTEEEKTGKEVTK